jgi:hypothetical protein
VETPFTVLRQVVQALEAHGIVYVVVGSFASSMRGLYRSTNDVDIVADIKPEHIASLVAFLQEGFYFDEQAIQRAVTQRRSFNAIHFDSVFKVDVFIPPGDEFSQQQLKRRQPEKISPDITEAIYVATAEDTILAKLRWYRAGDELSTTQWRDVLGMIGVQGELLDTVYLREWANKLNVHDLLEKALNEAAQS